MLIPFKGVSTAKLQKKSKKHIVKQACMIFYNNKCAIFSDDIIKTWDDLFFHHH